MGDMFVFIVNVVETGLTYFYAQTQSFSKASNRDLRHDQANVG